MVSHMQKHIDPAIVLPGAADQSPPKTPTEGRTESTPQSDRTDSADEIVNLDSEFGRLAMGDGRSRYMTCNHWASLDEEVEDLNSLLQGRPEETELRDMGRVPDIRWTNQATILPFASTYPNLSQLHPQRSKFQFFGISRIPRGLEALMMAVYFNVVVSLSPEECLQVLGGGKLNLLRTFKFATEQALARAGLLETDEIIVLQAFAIFLTALRIHNSARLMWTLTALLVRLAQNAGIHRDGIHFNLPPFAVEMRRRLWWCICVLDSRAREDTGYDATIPSQNADTQLPLNVNDSDLVPGMTEFPQPRVGHTDMIFSLVRYESTKVFQRLQYMSADSTSGDYNSSASGSLAKRTRAITDIQNRVHELYLKHLDLSDPFSWYTSTISRIVFTKMWLVTYHPLLRKSSRVDHLQDRSDRLFTASTVVVEYWLRLNQEKSTRQWRWLCETYIQWYALAFLLSELCERTHGESVERAWKAVDGALELGSSIYSSSCQSADAGIRQRSSVEEPVCDSYRPLGKLLEKARSARMCALSRDTAEASEISGQWPNTAAFDDFSGLPLDANNFCPPSWMYELAPQTNQHMFMPWQRENSEYYYEWPVGDAALLDSQVRDDLVSWTHWPMYPQADFVPQ
ncbi:hypothetical protein N7461_003005 [Penicillium sp. DV-2018c]|nr:hypothetical protein N7461_003005 [Penicillium sp. DV-2018c]